MLDRLIFVILSYSYFQHHRTTVAYLILLNKVTEKVCELNERISYFNFPNRTETIMDPCNRTSRRAHNETKFHFKPGLKKSLNGRVFVHEGKILSKFELRPESPKKRKAATV